MIPRTPTTARRSVFGPQQVITPKITTSPKNMANINALHRDLLSPNKKSQQYLNKLRMQMKQLDEIIESKKEEITHEYKSLLDEQIEMKKKIDLEYLEMYEEEDRKFFPQNSRKKQRQSRKSLLWDEDSPVNVSQQKIKSKKKHKKKTFFVEDDDDKSYLKDDQDTIEEDVDQCSPFESDQDDIPTACSTPIRDDDEIREILHNNHEETTEKHIEKSPLNIRKRKKSPILTARRSKNLITQSSTTYHPKTQTSLFEDLGKGSPQRTNFGRINIDRYDPEAAHRHALKLKQQQEFQKELDLQIKQKQERLRREEEDRRRKAAQERKQLEDLERETKKSVVRSSVSPPAKKQSSDLRISSDEYFSTKQTVSNNSHNKLHNNRSPRFSPDEYQGLTTNDEFPFNDDLENDEYLDIDDQSAIDEQTSSRTKNVKSSHSFRTPSPIKIPRRKLTKSPAIAVRNEFISSKKRNSIINNQRDSSRHISLDKPLPLNIPRKSVQLPKPSRKMSTRILSHIPRESNQHTFDKLPPLRNVINKSLKPLRRSQEDNTMHSISTSNAPTALKRHSVANPTQRRQQWDDLFELKKEIENEQQELKEKISGLLSGLKTKVPSLLSRESLQEMDRIHKSRKQDRSNPEAETKSRDTWMRNEKENLKNKSRRVPLRRVVKSQASFDHRSQKNGHSLHKRQKVGITIDTTIKRRNIPKIPYPKSHSRQSIETISLQDSLKTQSQFLYTSEADFLHCGDELEATAEFVMPE